MNSQTRTVEDIYELSPLQEGMLFQALRDPDGGAYFRQPSSQLVGLDVAAFRQAFQRIVERHPILRTSFHLEGLAKPIQAVHRHVTVPFEEQDWRGLTGEEQQQRLRSYLRENRQRGLPLTEAPVMRVALFRLTDEDYQFVWTRHHILVDGWSSPLVSKELFAFYDALRRGQDLTLPPARPYRDYIVWLQQQDLSKAEAFWRDTLKGFTAPTPLPVDRVVARSESVYLGEVEKVRLTAEVTAALRSLARQERLTLNTIAQGAWALLLGRYSGQDDAVFGTTVSGRPADLPGVESIVGLFINTLPVRVRLDPRKRILSWLKELQAQQVDARQYEYSPLGQVQGWSEVPRGTPLFESLVVFQNFPDRQRPDKGGRPQPKNARRLQVDNQDVDANFPLSLRVVPEAEELVLSLKYRSDLFDSSTAARLVEHVRVLLEGIAADPDRPLAQLELLSRSEQCRVLVEWNRTEADYPRDLCLHQLFERQVERTPDAVALGFEGRHLTYRELNERANRLAHHLRRLGVGPDVPVPLCLERSVELVVGLLGVLKAGGAYVPLGPDDPPARLAMMLRDLQSPVLLTQERLLDRLPEHQARVICLDSGGGGHQESAASRSSGSASGAGQQESAENPRIAVRPGHLAYIIYTSGSTGQPKGAMNTHEGIVNRLLWMQDTYKLNESDRVLQKTTYTFDVSVWEFFWPLLAGARLVVARPGGHQDPAYLVDVIAAERITTLHFVPSMLAVFLEARGLERCACLRRILCSGEALPHELQERFFARMAAELHNLYGPTEAAVDVTSWACSREDRRRLVPIGRPIANMRVYVLDAGLRPVPVGVVGELYLAGIGLARGYLGRPGLTADRFIPDPFAHRPGERLYRTGDRCRWLADGSVEFLGRIDHQVKIRGFRIELGEIETQLLSHPLVREAVALAREDSPGDKRLVGYVVSRNGEAPSVGQLREHLRGRLPEYMLPGDFVVLGALPLTGNGKVDRRALPAPGPARADSAGGYVAPRTPLERLLADRVAQVLGRQRVGVEDNFFELGGTSIKAAVLVNQLQQDLGETLYVVAVFDAPTAAGLAEFLQRQYPRSVARLLGVEAPGAAGDQRVTAEQLAHFRTLIQTLPPRSVQSDQPGKNRRAVFVLSTPRAGSTLMRVLLGGHPQLFAPPELDLLQFNTLAERRAAFSGRESFRLEGLLRAIMEIQDCDAEEAKRLVEGWEGASCSVKGCYARVQAWLGDRLLVDKTPSYALDLAALRRAEEDFEEPLYIHLVRHPGGMIHSFEEVKLEQIFFHYEHPFTPRQLAELIWVVSQQNITEFLRGVPASRQCRVRFEDVVRQPEEELRRLCGVLGLRYDPAMAQPYEERHGRMTDGIHPESRMLGAVKFHQHRGIDASVADRWRASLAVEALAPCTLAAASALGYDDPRQDQGEVAEGPTLTAIPRLARDEDVARTLDGLDQLSEAEVEALLGAVLAEE